MATRNSTQLYLIGDPINVIPTTKLPSIGQALQRFFYIHLQEKKSIKESANITINEILEIWGKAHIPTTQSYNAIAKLKSVHKKWSNLKKRINQRTPAQEEKEKDFQDKLNDLFDIAHADAMEMIKISEDRDFLLAQREKGKSHSDNSHSRQEY